MVRRPAAGALGRGRPGHSRARLSPARRTASCGCAPRRAQPCLSPRWNSPCACSLPAAVRLAARCSLLPAPSTRSSLLPAPSTRSSLLPAPSTRSSLLPAPSTRSSGTGSRTCACSFSSRRARAAHLGCGARRTGTHSSRLSSHSRRRGNGSLRRGTCICPSATARTSISPLARIACRSSASGSTATARRALASTCGWCT
jgi:hypothetical protein